MNIKLLALDLDGTLFGDDLFITPRTRQAIRAAKEQGVKVAIATGRMFTSAAQIAAGLDISGPLICYQGAMVRDTVTQETLYHKTIPNHLALEIIEETGRRGLHINVYLDDVLYVAARTPEADFYSRINMHMAVVEVGDLREWIGALEGRELTKMVIVTDPSKTNSVLEDFIRLFGDRLQVIKSHPRFTEFTNIECSKGAALAFLSSYYGVAQEDVMAIGDGHNDMDMIRWAGYGVAMGSAPPIVKDVARYVAPALSEEGAAEAIERYILGGISIEAAEQVERP